MNINHQNKNHDVIAELKRYQFSIYQAKVAPGKY